LAFRTLPYDPCEVLHRLLQQDDNAATYSDEPSQKERADCPNRSALRVTFWMKQDVPARYATSLRRNVGSPTQPRADHSSHKDEHAQHRESKERRLLHA